MKLSKSFLLGKLCLLGVLVQLFLGRVSAQSILYLADSYGVQTVSPGGTFAQNFIALPDGGSGLAFASSGNLFASSGGNSAIMEIGPGGAISTFVTLTNYGPSAMAFDANGDLFAAIVPTDSVLKITPGGVVTTFASGFHNPTDLAFDSNGNLYVANDLYIVTNGSNLNPIVIGGGTISKITPNGVVSTFAGFFNTPSGMAFDANDNLYVDDSSNNVFKITPNGSISTFFSPNPPGYLGALAFDDNGNLLASAGSNIYTITPGGNVSVYASVRGTEQMALGPASFSAGIPEPTTWVWFVGGLAVAMAAHRKFRR